MLALEIIQAAFGDCLLLRFGSPQHPRFVLVDGGPDQIYMRHLRHVLGGVEAEGGQVDLAVLSHVDRDHVTGLLDLFVVMEQKKAAGQSLPIAINALWHNSFTQQIDPSGTFEVRLDALSGKASALGAPMTLANMTLLDIQQGHRLRGLAQRLQIPLNDSFQGNVALIDQAPVSVTLDGGLKLHVVGPTKTNLEALQQEWLDWLDKTEANLDEDPLVMAMADRSIPNLSSIMLMVETSGHRMLLTGDGRGDHLLDGLDASGMLQNGRCHVDLLKVPHHGSDRNVTLDFFSRVTADKYVISADGKHDNPDLATLRWIVKAAQNDGRDIEIWLTNRTKSVDDLVAQYSPGPQSGYRLNILGKGQHSFRLDLA